MYKISHLLGSIISNFLMKYGISMSPMKPMPLAAHGTHEPRIKTKGSVWGRTRSRAPASWALVPGSWVQCSLMACAINWLSIWNPGKTHPIC